MRRFNLINLTAIATIIAAAAVLYSCSEEQDAYLRTLNIKAEKLEYIDSLNIEQYNLFQAIDNVKIDKDWLLLSASKGDYNLLFVNIVTSDHFFAIRRGRGPGEIIQGCSLHKCGDDAVYYDVNNAKCIKINSSESIRNRKIVMDTAAIFCDKASRPIYMTSCGADGFISGNMLDTKVWYSYYDKEGKILSSVAALNFDGYAEDDEAHLSSLLLSSKYASNPDGTKVCVASVPTASLSFSNVDSGKLIEYKRYEADIVGTTNGRITPEAISAFQGIVADDKYVYVIYSGHKLKDDVLPPNECRDLIVYDWDGNLVKRYLLNRNVSSVYIEGKTLWCTSTYPEHCVYKFILL